MDSIVDVASDFKYNISNGLELFSIDAGKEDDRLMDFDIRKFDEYREDNRLEVKKARGGLPNSLWESYSAMANCYGGC